MDDNKISLRKAIIEHLKTKKKYNNLMINYEEALRLIEERTAERNAIECDYRKCKAKFDKRVDMLLEENVELKRKLKEERIKLKELKNENKEISEEEMQSTDETYNT